MGIESGIRGVIALCVGQFCCNTLHDWASTNTDFQLPVFISFPTHESWDCLAPLDSAVLAPGLYSSTLHMFLHFPGQVAVWDMSLW